MAPRAVRLGALGGRLLTRREFGGALVAGAVASRAMATAPTYPPIRIRSLNHIALTVSDVSRSAAWYQRIFGMPVQFTQDLAGGKVAILALGSGPEHLALFPANGAQPAIRHLGLGVPNFDRNLIDASLKAHSVKAEWRTRRAPGGDVQELMVRDPDNLPIQLQDTRYCGGAGVLGNLCPEPWTQPPAGPPPVRVRMWNHLSIHVADEERSVLFYQRVFDLRLKTMDFRQQAPIRILGIGAGPQTVNPYLGGAPGGGHFCFGVENFDFDRVAKLLEGHGIKVQASASKPACCGSTIVYNPKETVSSSMLKDPDGLGVQLTDVNFCAGSGPLGQYCP